MNKEKYLKKYFYKIFTVYVLVYGIGMCIFLGLLIVVLLDCLQTINMFEICLLIVGAIVFLYFLFTGIKEMITLFLDFISIRKNQIKQIIGTVVSTERKLQGGEVITYDYYAHVNDEATGDTIRLKMIENEEKIQMSIHKQCRYSFLYLPHTKYAVITETFSYIGENEAEVNFPLNRTDKSP